MEGTRDLQKDSPLFPRKRGRNGRQGGKAFNKTILSYALSGKETRPTAEPTTGSLGPYWAKKKHQSLNRKSGRKGLTPTEEDDRLSVGKECGATRHKAPANQTEYIPKHREKPSQKGTNRKQGGLGGRNVTSEVGQAADAFLKKVREKQFKN